MGDYLNPFSPDKDSSDTGLTVAQIKAIVREMIAELGLQNYATKTELKKVSNKQVNVDLQNYATKAYVTSVLADYSAPDLTTYATKAYVATAVANLTAPDLTPYATITSVSSQLSDAIDECKAYTEEKYDDAVDAATDLVTALAEDLEEYAKKTELPDVTGYLKGTYNPSTMILTLDLT